MAETERCLALRRCLMGRTGILCVSERGRATERAEVKAYSEMLVVEVWVEELPPLHSLRVCTAGEAPWVVEVKKVFVGQMELVLLHLPFSAR